MAAIYRKTSKGLTELGTRALKLSPRLRSLLILIDGRRSDDELLRIVPALGAEGVQALLTEGLIELIGVTNDVAPSSARAEPAEPPRKPAPTPSTGPATPALQPLRRDLVRALTDLAGPLAEPMAIKIERAGSRAELSALQEPAARLGRIGTGTRRRRNLPQALCRRDRPTAARLSADAPPQAFRTGCATGRCSGGSKPA